jgi:hypothetical protein
MDRIIVNQKDDDTTESSEDSDEESMKGLDRLPVTESSALIYMFRNHTGSDD